MARLSFGVWRASIERRLVRDWRWVLRHSWSVRLLGVAFLFSGVETAMPFLQGVLPIPQWLFGSLAGVATGGAFVARLVAQKELKAEGDN